jgi:hypothetical protein
VSGHCSSCKAPVRWAVFGSGKPCPLDPTPDPDKGNIVILNSERPPLCIVIARKLPGDVLYTSHFATCPNAAAHRKRKATSRPDAFSETPPSAAPARPDGNASLLLPGLCDPDPPKK